MKMKKIISMVLCLCMLVQNCPVAFASETGEMHQETTAATEAVAAVTEPTSAVTEPTSAATEPSAVEAPISETTVPETTVSETTVPETMIPETTAGEDEEILEDLTNDVQTAVAATITGVSIIVDGTTYTSGNVTIDTDSEVILVVTGSNLSNGTEDNVIEYSAEFNTPVTSDYFDFSDDGTSGTQSLQTSDFVRSSGVEITYSNDYTLEDCTYYGTGIFVTYVGDADTEEPAEDIALYFQNTAGWSRVYIYYWSDVNTGLTTWPGEVMTQVADGIYSYSVPGETQYVIFSDGGTVQTADLSVPTDGKNQYDNSTGGWSVYAPAVCSCEFKCSEGNENSECAVCKEDISDCVGKVCSHTGGKATCTTLAVCDTCGASYGEVDITNHESFSQNGFCEICDAYEPAVLNGGVYEISNAGQLYWFAAKVNGGDKNINGKLMKDIVVNPGTFADDGTYTPKNGETVREWTTIGYWESESDYVSYTGRFDGGEHTISGLYFNDSTLRYVGLFCRVGEGGEVQNVGVVNSYLRGRNYVGGVAGYNKGTVTNCYNTGTVTGGIAGGVAGYNEGTVTNCYNTGTVSGSSSVGGVVGSNEGTVRDCHNTGTVSGNRTAGGVVGDNWTTVTNCYNTGDVSGNMDVGGVAGYDYGTVTNCYYLDTAASGAINGADKEGQAEAKTAEQFASGEVAYLLNGSNSEGVWKQTLGTDAAPSFTGGTVYSVKNCEGESDYSNTNETLGHKWVDGTCSVCDKVCPGHTGGEGTCNEQAVCTICGASYYEVNAHSTGADGDKPATCKDKAYCSVCESYYGEVDTTNHDSSVAYNSNGFCENGCYEPAVLNGGVYEISNAGQLYWFAAKVTGGEADLDGKLMQDIVVNPGSFAADGTYTPKNGETVREWTTIGYWVSDNDNVYYTGSFDGGEHTISGLYFNDSETDCVGLFGTVGTGGILKNVGVVNSYLRGRNYVGGVAGYNEGTVTNCYNTCDVSGESYVGGVVGYNKGTVTNCYNTGDVSGSMRVGGVVGYNSTGTVANCYNTGDVSGNDYVGGVVGYNSTGTVSNSYNTGDVSGSERVGGVVGWINGGTVTNCYNTGNVSGTEDVGGTVGRVSFGSYSNLYYLDTCGAACKRGTAKTAEQFASGEVAYLLNGSTSEGELVWKQTLGTDAAPSFTGGTVYSVKNCMGEPDYSNTNEMFGHKWVNGTCSVCGEACAHTGGTATCKELAVCDICGESYGELAAHSTGADGDKPATCKDKAYCSVCDSEYGDVDKTNHDETVAYENGFCPYCDVFEPAVLNNGVYEISNAGQLYWFADKVTNENAAYGSANAILTADITVNENVLAADGTANAGTFRVWTPIGKVGFIDNKKVEYPYTGTFEGNGKTVSGLYFNDTSANFSVGLFSLVGEGGIVKNVGVADSYICGNSPVGAVAGSNYGTVTGCYNTGTVISSGSVGGVVGSNDGTVTNCYNTGTVSGTSSVGGVVGSNIVYSGGVYYNPIVTDCHNSGTVSGTSSVGGVVGNNSGIDRGSTRIKAIAKDCHNTGTVSGTTDVGGVAGSNGGTATGCYNTGTVRGATNVGGVVGSGNASNCYNTGTVSGTTSVGGVAGCLMGEAGEASVMGCYSSGTVSGEDKVGGVVGYNNAAVTNCYFDSTVYTGDAIGNDSGTATNVEGKSTEQFKSGEVAYLLRTRATEGTNVWGQDLDNGKTVQTVPTFTGAKVYCGYTSCGDTAAKYTNDETISATKPEHTGKINYTPTEDGTQHIGTYECCGSTVTEEHSNTAEGDRAADCNSKAYCSVCKSEYGEVDTTKHDTENAEYDNGFCIACDAYEPAELVDGVYQIGNAGQLYWFSDKVDNENATYGSANVVLTADITVNEGRVTSNGTGRRVWNPIGWYYDTASAAFSGTFDGNGKTVSGLYFSDKNTYDVALIAYTSETALVKNITLTNSYFNGYARVAGIVAFNYGTVSGCFNEAAISGKSNIGGIVGYNEGTVELCGNTGSVTGGGLNHAGGIAGSNKKTIRNCWNTANIESDNMYAGGIAGTNNSDYGAVPLIENCWSTGTVSSSLNRNTIGGIVGFAWGNSGGVRNCYSLMKPIGAIKNAHPVTNVEAVTLDQFASGEVAYLLRTRATEGTNVWGQDLDNGKTVQTVPTFTGAAVYYGYISCGSDAVEKYTNNAKASATKPEHTGKINYTPTEDGTQHIGTYECCGTTKDAEDHSFDSATGMCVCDAECAHNFIDGVCEYCGYACKHPTDGITESDYRVDWDNDRHYFQCQVCYQNAYGGHDYTYDAEYHVCICGAAEPVAYKFVWTDENGNKESSGTVSYGDTLSYYEPSISENGYYVIWYSDEALTQKFDVQNTPVTEAVTLYAKFVQYYNLYITGIRVDELNASDILGDGTVSYDPATNTLTLNNANIQGNDEDLLRDTDIGISYYGDGETLEIKLVGNNTVAALSDPSISPTAIDVTGSLKITGEGNLTVSAAAAQGTYQEGAYGIRVIQGDLTLAGTGTITTSVTSESRIIYMSSIRVAGNITIESGTVNAYANHTGTSETDGVADSVGAIFAEGNGNTITINGGTVNAYSGAGYVETAGIGGDLGTEVVINGGTVTAVGGTGAKSEEIGLSGISYGIGVGATSDWEGNTDGGTITINGGSVTATGGTADGRSHGLGAEGGVTITNGTVTATGGTAGENSYGIGAEGGVTISGGTVQATAGNASGDSYGIGSLEDIQIQGQANVKATAGSGRMAYGIGTMGKAVLEDSITLEAQGSTMAVGAASTTTLEAGKHWVTVTYRDGTTEELAEVDSETWANLVRVKIEQGYPSFTVAWLDETGKEIKTETLEYGTVIDAPEAPEKAGDEEYHYTFSHWEDEAGEQLAVGTTKVTGDVSYTAKYNDAEMHDGSEATCTAKAFCDICKTAYGDYADHAMDWNSENQSMECQVCGLTISAEYTKLTYTEVDGKNRTVTGSAVITVTIAGDDEGTMEGEQLQLVNLYAEGGTQIIAEATVQNGAATFELTFEDWQYDYIHCLRVENEEMGMSVKNLGYVVVDAGDDATVNGWPAWVSGCVFILPGETVTVDAGTMEHERFDAWEFNTNEEDDFWKVPQLAEGYTLESNPLKFVMPEDGGVNLNAIWECVHSDEEEADHYCDHCGEIISECSDAATDKDHTCDVCNSTEILEDCSDAKGDGNHDCDICGEENVSEHVYGDDAKCTECGIGALLKITFADQTVIYSDNIVAYSDADDGSEKDMTEIQLLQDITGDSMYVMAMLGTVTLDLNGHALTGNGMMGVYVSGDLTITDNSENGGGSVNGKLIGVMEMSDSAKLTIQGNCSITGGLEAVSAHGVLTVIGSPTLTATGAEGFPFGASTIYFAGGKTDLSQCTGYDGWTMINWKTDPTGSEAVDVLLKDMQIIFPNAHGYVVNAAGEVLADDDIVAAEEIVTLKMSDCADEDKDHACDICGDVLSDCSDAEGDGDHKCDECDKVLSDCFDEDGDDDHDCDECGSTGVTDCTDEDGDGDHKCDECGEEGITDCFDEDGDGDHNCDECGKEGVTDCFDGNGDGDHKCDECGKDGMNACADSDTDKDHNCDECGKQINAHVPGAVVKENEIGATCSTAGSYENVVYCTVCDEELSREKVSVPATGHSDEGKDYVCDECGEKLCTEHTEVIVPGEDATCTDTGLTDGKKCGICGEVLKKQEVIPAKGHTEEIVPSKEATCTETGLSTGKKCSVCGVTLEEQQIVAAKGHTPKEIAAITPTCTTGGFTAGSKCDVCDTVLKAPEEVAATGHDYESTVTTAPTCTENGLRTYICKNDKTHTYTESIPATGHADKNQDFVCDECGKDICQQHTEQIIPGKAATCTEEGISEGKQCAVCHEILVRQEVIPALGHAYDDGVVTKEATCTQKGEKTFTCGNDKNHSYTEEIPATGHNHSAVVTKPTCTAEGYTTYTCDCGDSYVKDYTKPLGHSYTDGWDRYCDVCGADRSIKTVPMYRLYDPISGEHHYTGSTEERDNLTKIGWNYEGVAWNAPVYIGDPVYRFYNPNTGDHHYTTDFSECGKMRGAGWVYEGVAWNSAPATEVPIYRLYNPNAVTGIHHYTGSVEERDWLVSLGWKYEGIGWYGLLY